MKSWQPLLQDLSKQGRIFTYNRAGFKGSHSHNSSRSASVITGELNRLLNQLQLPSPYILVGHSLGGAYMELFAKTYPEQVAGVVLIDPNASKFPQACRQASLGLCAPPSGMPFWAKWWFPDAVSGEIKGFGKTHQEVNQIKEFPDVPLVVLSAPLFVNPETENDKKRSDLNTQVQRELSKQSSLSKFIYCDSCNHYIHHDQPQLLFDAIDWIKQRSDDKVGKR